VINPWLGMALIVAALGGLIGAMRLYQRVASPHPELTRKLVHIGMGLVVLWLPWLFDDVWPVLVLAGVSVAGLLLVRVVGALKRAVGGVLGGVGRSSFGELYYPLAMAALFVLYKLEHETPDDRRVMLYCIPVLLLALADAAAALVGVRYGLTRYHTAEGLKSAEGSVAFFTCAFLLVHVPLLLWTDLGRVETVLVALLLAWLATLFEAVAWAGLDNLVLPLASFLLLRLYMQMSIADLLLRLAETAVLLGILLLYVWRTTLRGNAVLGAFLVGYACWALQGWPWVLPPLLLFLTYSLLSRRLPVSARRVHNVHGVTSVCAAGLVWLFLAHILGIPEFYYPFTLSFAAQLGIIGVASLKYDYPEMGPALALGLSTGIAWLLLFVPYLLVAGLVVKTWSMVPVLAAFPVMAAAALVFYGLQPNICDCPTDTARWVRQGMCGAGASLLGLLPLYII
jgi:phytol kinase